jgi:NAD(P) transhydrogenase subunit beta
VIPIGGADMPVVISLLNSYAGLADAAMGFVLMNKIQIITGSLDGTSGFLLSLLMCRAMNRSALNVLFGAFGKVVHDEAAQAGSEKGTVRSIGGGDGRPSRLPLHRRARPRHAVAQAQHAVAELGSILKTRGVDVKYAIHPVAGRMPGHMNVLLAEANVPYDKLYEMEQINPYLARNDVTNPAARSTAEPSTACRSRGRPREGDHRLGRSMRPSLVDNDLYYNDKCMMLFGDARPTSFHRAEVKSPVQPQTPAISPARSGRAQR